jgi:hypothetical protein
MENMDNSEYMKMKNDDITADVFDFEDLNVPIPDNDTLNRIAMNRLLLNLRPGHIVKDADANNAAKLVLTYTKALVSQTEIKTTEDNNQRTVVFQVVK